VQGFGSSLAVTLPAFFVKVCEVEKGSVVKVLYGTDDVLIMSFVEDTKSLLDCLRRIINKMEEKLKKSGVLRRKSEMPSHDKRGNIDFVSR